MLKDVLQRMNTTQLTPPYNLIVPQQRRCRTSRARRVLSLARRGDAEADARGRIRMGNRLLHQPDRPEEAAEVLRKTKA
jgi:hypothetical protein